MASTNIADLFNTLDEAEKALYERWARSPHEERKMLSRAFYKLNVAEERLLAQTIDVAARALPEAVAALKDVTANAQKAIDDIQAHAATLAAVTAALSAIATLLGAVGL